MAKRPCQPNKTLHCLQNSLWMQQILQRWDWKTYQRHDKGALLRHPTRTQTSIVSEHAYNTGHYPLWDEVKFSDHTLVHMQGQRCDSYNNINRDSGIKIQEAWMSTIKKYNNRRDAKKQTAERTTHQNSEDRNAPITSVENQPITAEHSTSA